MVYAKPNKVSWYRVKKGMTLAQLAKLSGLGDSYIRGVEQGRVPSEENKVKIAAVLEKSVEELFGDDDNF